MPRAEDIMAEHERYTGYTDEGRAAARLDIAVNTALADEFVRAHKAKASEMFKSSILPPAASACDSYAAAGRAFAFRPYALFISYDGEQNGGRAAVTVTYTLRCGTRVISRICERHLFDVSHGECAYLSRAKTRKKRAFCLDMNMAF